MMWRIRIIVSSLVFLALTGAGFAQAARSQDDEIFLKFAGEVGLSSVLGDTPGKFVLKWTKAMAVDFYFSAKTPIEIVTSMSGAFNDAQQASGLQVQFYRGLYNVMVLTADWKAGGL